MSVLFGQYRGLKKIRNEGCEEKSSNTKFRAFVINKTATHISRDSFKRVAGNAKLRLGECPQWSTLPSWGMTFPVIHL